ncbi:MAG: glycosyltransferase family 2 protein [Actinomycetota bacterium]
MTDVVLPVLNEAEALPRVLAAMPTGFRPIVVDNNSTDGSAVIARGLGATVISEPSRGFGAACFAGLIRSQSEIVCFMDCDGSLDPRDLSRVVGPVADGGADLVLSCRRPEARAWPLHARFANRLLANAIARRTGVSLSDLGPMRAARREPLIGLGLADRRFGWPLEMVLVAAKHQWRIVEVPVPYYRRAGRSKVTGTVSGTVRAARDMTGVLRCRP